MKEHDDISSAGVQAERHCRDAIDLLLDIERQQRVANSKATNLHEAALEVIAAIDDDDDSALDAALVALRRAVGATA